MRFYLNPELPITSDYHEPRLTVAGKHLGWDHLCPRDTPILASERVELHFQIIRQHSGVGEDGVLTFAPDLSWPDGTWWPYSRYYEWWIGGLAVCFGAAHTYVFGHIEPAHIYERWHASGREYRMEKRRLRRANGTIDYTQYVYPEINWEPIFVEEGDFVAPTGIAGFDTEPHLHVQVMVPGRGRHTHVDPVTVWPSQYARLCADKHSP